jgi:hypothetical protein
MTDTRNGICSCVLVMVIAGVSRSIIVESSDEIFGNYKHVPQLFSQSTDRRTQVALGLSTDV